MGNPPSEGKFGNLNYSRLPSHRRGRISCALVSQPLGGPALANSSGPIAHRDGSARKTRPSRSATCSKARAARSGPSAQRWNGESMYVPVFPTISILPM